MGEQLVKKKLQNKGWTFIAQNFHTRYGEIDLIFQDHDNIIFIEVKTRRNLNSGNPEEAITSTKLKHFYKAAEIFLLKNSKYQNLQPRLDAATIYLNLQRKFIFKYYENIS